MILPSREEAGVIIVSVNGRIDHTSSEAFSSALAPFMQKCVHGNPPVLLDFSGVEYISSAGLRVLMLCSRQAKAQKGAFSIAALQPLVQEVFAISRFNLIVPCYLNVAAACKVLGS